MEVTTIGIDLAKSVFAVSCADGRGKLVVRKQLRRGQVLEFVSRFKHCVVGMEACGGAHHWARAIEQLGHEVRLMSPALVRPYCTGPSMTATTPTRFARQCAGRRCATSRSRVSPSRTCWRYIGCARN